MRPDEAERLITDAERDALRQLLETRAELWRRSEQPERAARDSATAAMIEDARR